MVRDMTHGSPVKLLLGFWFPLLLGNLFQQVYNLVDSVIVGRYVGADALAAIGATTSVTFLFFALCNGIGTGGGIITSQHFGRKDDAAVRSCIVNTGYIMVAFPLVVGTVAFFLTEPVLKLLDTPAEIMSDAGGYIFPVRLTCIAQMTASTAILDTGYARNTP